MDQGEFHMLKLSQREQNIAEHNLRQYRSGQCGTAGKLELCADSVGNESGLLAQIQNRWPWET
jgi:hypothetical protein